MFILTRMVRVIPFISIFLLSFTSIIVFFSANAPDVDTYLTEISAFSYDDIRIDYFSWAILNFFSIDTISGFHTLSITVLFLLLFFLIWKGSTVYVALLLLMPMIVGSQIRLLFAAAAFLCCLVAFNGRFRFLFSILFGSLFHSSFIFIFIFPIYLFLPEAISYLTPEVFINPVYAKLEAYSLQDIVPVSFFSISLIFFIYVINLAILALDRDPRAIIIGVYIVLLFSVPGEFWILYRRSAELVLFLSFPFYFREYLVSKFLHAAYFSSIFIYSLLNIKGYSEKLVF